MPVSDTSIQALFPVTPASTEMVPPSGVYLMELPTTFIITCSKRLRSPVITGSRLRSPYFCTRVWLWFWASRATARHTDSMASARGKRLMRRSARPESRRLRVSRSWTMRVMRSVSLMMMSRKLSAVSRGISGSSRSVSA